MAGIQDPPPVHLPGGGPPNKGINKDSNYCFSILCGIVRVEKLRFLAFPQGPGGFREVRGAGRNHFHLSWYLSVPGVTSYDQKTNHFSIHFFQFFPEKWFLTT